MPTGLVERFPAEVHRKAEKAVRKAMAMARVQAAQNAGTPISAHDAREAAPEMYALLDQHRRDRESADAAMFKAVASMSRSTYALPTVQRPAPRVVRGFAG